MMRHFKKSVNEEAASFRNPFLLFGGLGAAGACYVTDPKKFDGLTAFGGAVIGGAVGGTLNVVRKLALSEPVKTPDMICAGLTVAWGFFVARGIMQLKADDKKEHSKVIKPKK